MHLLLVPFLFIVIIKPCTCLGTDNKALAEKSGPLLLSTGLPRPPGLNSTAAAPMIIRISTLCQSEQLTMRWGEGMIFLMKYAVQQHDLPADDGRGGRLLNPDAASGGPMEQSEAGKTWK